MTDDETEKIEATVKRLREQADRLEQLVEGKAKRKNRRDEVARCFKAGVEAMEPEWKKRLTGH